MRGRKPRPLTVAATDRLLLEAVAQSRQLPFFQVQHARVVLAVAAGEPIHAVAARLEYDRTTVWRLCRRYEQAGLQGLLMDCPRLGRPQELSPPPACTNRRTGLPGTDCQGPSHHPLDQSGSGSPGGRRWHRRRHQPTHGPAHPQKRGLAAAPHPLRADFPARQGVQGACGASALVLCQCGTVGPPGHLGRGGR